MSQFANKARNVVWFRNDLRLRDNAVLAEVVKRARGVDTVFVYCFDPRSYKQTKYNSFKTGIYRAQFTIEAVANLRKNLRQIGCELLVACKRPEDVIPPLFCGKSGHVYVSEETTSEEINVEMKVSAKCLEGGVNLARIRDYGTLYHPDDLPFASSLQDMPDTFTVFRERIEKTCRVRPILPTIQSGQLRMSPETRDELMGAGILDSTCGFDFLPTLAMLGLAAAPTPPHLDSAQHITTHSSSSQSKHTIITTEISAAPTTTSSPAPPPTGVLHFIGGEDEALSRLDAWMFRDDRLREYFDLRNGMLGEAYSSKLSPWLALGCISARTIYYAAKRYEKQRNISNKSTYWLVFELIWRDYFKLYCKKYGNKVFQIGGARQISKPWRSDDDGEMARRWRTGTTGVPLVDANMRELLQTGWMSNRGRQNVASFLVHDLKLDWRIGAAHFESLLLDHDVSSNYGNWNHAAGLNGGRVNQFNMLKQSRDYDPTGAYIRHWLPELANVHPPMIFEPWKLTPSLQAHYRVTIGDTYPANILLLAPAAAAAKRVHTKRPAHRILAAEMHTTTN